ASATAAAAASAATSAPPATPTASVAASAAAAGELGPVPGCAGRFLVEDKERAQAYVGNLLLAQRDLRRGGLPPRRVRGRYCGCCVRTADQRQGADDPDNRDRLLSLFSLRRALAIPHRGLPCLKPRFRRP